MPTGWLADLPDPGIDGISRRGGTETAGRRGTTSRGETLTGELIGIFDLPTKA